MTEQTRDVKRGRWYPAPPPGLPGETGDTYTNRLLGSDKTGRVPYDHQRNRQCSIGYHSECSCGPACECPCHTDPWPTEAQIATLTEEQRAGAVTLAGLYDLPEASGFRVIVAAVEAMREWPMTRPWVELKEPLERVYQSELDAGFLADVSFALGFREAWKAEQERLKALVQDLHNSAGVGEDLG